MPPSLVWGVGAGLTIAAIDTLAALLMTRLDSASEATLAMIQMVDLVANVALYSLIGVRVASATGVVRDAAEAGVIAAVLVAAIAIGVSFVLGTPGDPDSSRMGVVDLLAFNVALGGILAILGGWMGRRAHEERSGPSS